MLFLLLILSRMKPSDGIFSYFLLCLAFSVVLCMSDKCLLAFYLTVSFSHLLPERISISLQSILKKNTRYSVVVYVALLIVFYQFRSLSTRKTRESLKCVRTNLACISVVYTVSMDSISIFIHDLMNALRCTLFNFKSNQSGHS